MAPLGLASSSPPAPGVGGSPCQRAATPEPKPARSLGPCREGSSPARAGTGVRVAAPRPLRAGEEDAPVRGGRGPGGRFPRGGSGLLLGAQVSSSRPPAAGSGAASFSLPPHCWGRSAPSARLAPARASSRSLSPFPSSLRGARSRGAPGKMAAAGGGGGGGEGGAGLGGAAGPQPGSGRPGPGPSAEARDDVRGPAPAPLQPEEVAARLQRMRRELSNRRKILVKNLPQDSNCQVREGAARRSVLGLRGRSFGEKRPPRCPGWCPALGSGPGEAGVVQS